MSRPSGEAATARLGRAFQELIPALILDNDRIARSVGLTLVDNQVLHALSLAEQPLDQSELGQRIEQPSSTVSRAIDRLEHAGYVHRVRHPSDRRRLVVEPVAARVAELGQHYQPFIEAMSRAAEGFTPDELEVVARYLTALVQLRQADPARDGSR